MMSKVRVVPASGAGLPRDCVEEVRGSNDSDAPGKPPVPCVGIR